jgi:hypothetical protein
MPLVIPLSSLLVSAKISRVPDPDDKSTIGVIEKEVKIGAVVSKLDNYLSL